MQKIKKIAIICLIAIFITISTYTTSSASVEITEENLQQSMQSLMQSSTATNTFGDIQITLSEGIMKVTIGEEDTYEINYDLTKEQPTFSYEYQVKQGMTYAEYEKEYTTQVLLLIGYIASANIQGADIEDATTYILFQYIEKAFETSGTYEIVDDITNPNIEKTENPNIIYASEFGEKAIEYINAIYPNATQSVGDQEDLNSYKITTKKEQESETTYKIKHELTVNTEANYSRLEGYAETMELKSETGENQEPSGSGNQNGNQNGSGNQSGNQNGNGSQNGGNGSNGTISGQNPTPSTSGQTYTENGKTITTLPYAGITKILATLITIATISSILYATAIRRYKDIK